MISMIVNPISGTGRAKAVGEKAAALLHTLNIKFSMHLTEAVGHATILARQAAERGDETVIAVGGDGTVNEVAAGLNETSTALGIIPAGNGNDFAKALGIPKAWDTALHYMLNHPPRRVDTGKANDRFFINICGTGFDVMVLENMLKAKRHLHGKLPYLYGIFITMLKFKCPHMRIDTAEGLHIDKPVAHFSIANGQYFGSGIRIMPLSKVDDGVFDIMMIDKISRWKIFCSLPSLLKGTIIKKPIAHHYRTKECTLFAPNMHLEPGRRNH